MNENIDKSKVAIASRIFLGLFLCLIATILFLDLGYIARTLTFLFTISFGFTSYFFYLLFFFLGIFILLRSKKIEIQLARYLPGIVLILLGASALLSYFSDKDFALSLILPKMKELYQSGNYYSSQWIRKIPFVYQYLVNPALSVDVGGGLIGDLELASLNAIGVPYLSLSLIITIITLGFVALILPLVFALRKKPKTQKKIKKRVISKDGIEDIVIDNTKETIKSASKKPSSSKDKTFVISEIEQKGDVYKEKDSQGSLDFVETNSAPVGGFKKAIFKKPNDDFSLSQKTSPTPNEKVIIGEDEEEIEVLKPKEIVNEQLFFEFEEKKEEEEISISLKSESTQPTRKEEVLDEAKEKTTLSTQKKTRTKFVPPDNSLLATYEVMDASSKNNLIAERRKDKINEIFGDLKIGATCVSYVVGPAVTRFNIAYDSAVSIRAVANAFDDIQLRLGGVVGRFQAIVEGEPYSGMELPNAAVTMVGFKDVLENLPPHETKPLSLAFGKDISGKIIFADLNEFPHLLISGTTGSGKSIFIHSLLMTLIMRNNPDDLKIVLIDPKRVEMAMYADGPHLLCPIITDAGKAKVAMEKLDHEMERRYGILAKTRNTDMKSYREYCKTHEDAEWLPYIVVILDEYADLVDRAKDIQPFVVSIAQKARAAGIHIVISTQRPSTNVITGVIKGNLPTRVALMTSSAVDSITIIGEGGAEKLLGRGDMLVQSPLISRTGCVRLQGCFVSNSEIVRVVEYLKENYKTDFNPEFLDLIDRSKELTTPNFSPLGEGTVAVDEKYELVKETVMQQEYSSISRIQREFGFGFSRAGRIFALLQKEGIVASAPETQGSSKGCKVLVHDNFYNYNNESGSEELTNSESEREDN